MARPGRWVNPEYLDDDQPPARETPCGSMLGARRGHTTAAHRVRLPWNPAAIESITRRPHGRRDLLMLYGAAVGLSPAWLGKAVGVSRSRAKQILVDIKAELGVLATEPEAERSEAND